jgi:hypothetical protein
MKFSEDLIWNFGSIDKIEFYCIVGCLWHETAQLLVHYITIILMIYAKNLIDMNSDIIIIE